jgi:hypothetical protein
VKARIDRRDHVEKGHAVGRPQYVREAGKKDRAAAYNGEGEGQGFDIELHPFLP